MHRPAIAPAARALWRNPVFTCSGVVVLALGLSAATTLFSVLDAVVLRPLAFHDPDRLVLINERTGGREIAVSWPDYLDWRRGLASFEDMAARQFEIFTLTGLGDPEQIEGSNVTANLFAVLGVQPRLGRSFTAAEDRPGGPRAVIVTDGFWRRKLASDPAILGRSINLGGEPFTIVGVMPPGFRYPVAHERGEVFVPIGLTTPEFDNRKLHPGISVLARLKRGIDLRAAAAELANMTARLAREHPDTNREVDAVAHDLTEQVTGASRRGLIALFGAVLFLLCIACANVANLLLARAAGRARERAIRVALGATRLDLASDALAESLVLTAMACALGLALASVALRALAGLLDELPRAPEIAIGGRAVAFSIAISAVMSVVFALVAPKPSLSIRRSLIAGEVALSMALLSGAGLLASTFLRLAQTSPGFQAGGVLTLQTLLPDSKYIQREHYAAVLAQWLGGIQRLPGVRAAAFGPLPGAGIRQEPFALPDRAGNDLPTAETARITPQYFDTLRIPLLRGRAFTQRDALRTPRVAIVDQRLAQSEFGSEDPIGKRISVGGVWHEIVGVAGHAQINGLDQPPQFQIYLPFWQAPVKFVSVLIAAPGVDRSTVMAGVRRELARLDADQPVYRIRALEEVVEAGLRPKRLAFVLLGLFAGLGLLLSAVGVAAVTAHSVSRRTREFGVRMALGARSADVVGIALWDALGPGLFGLVCGVLLASLLTRFLSGLLYGVSPLDPITFAGAGMALCVALLGAAWLPARRASRIDPAMTLRHE